MGLIIKIKKFILRFAFPKNVILFESRPIFSDNTKAVFDEMIKRGLNKRYKFFWVSYKDDEIVNSINTVSYNTKRFKWLLAKSKALVSCNRFLVADPYFKIKSFYLCHGNPLKNTKGYYVFPDLLDYIICSSDGMKKINIDFYGYSNERLITLGYPRNDVLTNVSIDLHRFFKTSYKKIVVWYPTYRQGKGQGVKTGSNHALPIVWDEKRAEELNEFAKKNDVLIVLKPHFAQDVSYVQKLDLSNIVFIDDKFFKANDITSYEFVGSCDALLTDFSSIYYDYTLCDKPIGLIWEDYEEYKQNPGFVVNMDYMMKGGEKIYDLNDFKVFIKHVAAGEDVLKEERREIRDFANLSTDGKNAQRVVDFIVEKAGLIGEKNK